MLLFDLSRAWEGNQFGSERAEEGGGGEKEGRRERGRETRRFKFETTTDYGHFWKGE